MPYLFSVILIGSIIALIVGLIRPFPLTPKGKKLNRKKLAVIFSGLAFVSFILLGMTVPKSSTSSENADKTMNVQSQSPEDTFKRICEKYGGIDNCVYTKDSNGKWTVAQIYQFKDDFMLLPTAKQVSRDFIFEVYATKLPVSHVAISLNFYSGKQYYRAGLGEDVAKTQPETTWTSDDVGPTIFYDFLKSHTTGSAGDGKDSTYIETNLQ